MGHIETPVRETPNKMPPQVQLGIQGGPAPPTYSPRGSVLGPKSLGASWEPVEPEEEEDLDFGDDSPNLPLGEQEPQVLHSSLAASAAAIAVATMATNKPPAAASLNRVGGGSLPMLPRAPLGKGPVSYIERVMPHRISHGHSDKTPTGNDNHHSDDSKTSSSNNNNNNSHNNNSSNNSNNSNDTDIISKNLNINDNNISKNLNINDNNSNSSSKPLAAPLDSLHTGLAPRTLSSAGPGSGGATSLRSFGSAAAGNIKIGAPKDARRSRALEALSTRGSTAPLPARIAPLRVPTCCGNRLAEACVCCGPKPKTDTLDDPWEERRQVTGATARLVRYSAGDLPWRDISFSGGGGDRIQVTWMQTHGRAHVAGVKLGDTLASIDGRQIEREEHADAVYQRLTAPCVLIFLGFVGKMNAEVRLTTRLPKCGMSLHEEIIQASPITAALEGTPRPPEAHPTGSGLDYDDDPEGRGPAVGRIEEEIDFYRSNESIFFVLGDEGKTAYQDASPDDQKQHERQHHYEDSRSDASKVPERGDRGSRPWQQTPPAPPPPCAPAPAAATTTATTIATTATATAKQAPQALASPHSHSHADVYHWAAASSPASSASAPSTSVLAANNNNSSSNNNNNSNSNSNNSDAGGGGFDASGFWSAVAACADDLQEYASAALLAAAPAPSTTLLPSGPIVLELKAREARALLGSIMKQNQSQSRGESRSPPSSVAGIRADSGATEELHLSKSIHIDF